MDKKLLNTYRIFDEYEKRFAAARCSHKLREPWKEHEREEIKNLVKDVLCFNDDMIPQISVIDKKIEVRGGIKVTDCMYRSWESFYGVFTLFEPNRDGKCPLIFVCPGHGEEGRLTDCYQEMAFRLANMGAYVILNDNIGQGSRSQFGHWDCVAPFYCGLTLQGMIVAETMALIRYAKELDFVDVDRIGICGNSGGGTLTEFLAALEPSITAAASSGYPSEFPYILQKERMHCACNILNHFAGRLEMWEVYSLFAPKPLMIHQGSYDHLIPLDYFLRTARKLSIVYEMMGKKESFRREATPTRHSWDGPDFKLLEEFFKRHFDLGEPMEEFNPENMIPIENLSVAFPDDAVSTDKAAQMISGKKMPDGIKLEDVFVPMSEGKRINPDEIRTDLGRGSVMRVWAQFEASL